MMLFKLAIIWATLTSATQAQNSACTAATSISALPASVSGDTSNVSPVQDVAAESCQLARGPLASSWYSYVAESDGCLTAKVTPPAADEWDTILTAHSGDSCSALSCVAMNDDVDVVTERGSEVRINAVTGTTYYFMVAGYDNDEPGGRFEFALSQTSDATCSNPTGNQWCPICPDGGQPSATAIFDENVLCSGAGADEESVEGDEACGILQVIGSAVCGCTPASTATCSLCPSSEPISSPMQSILVSETVTCGDISVVGGSDSCGANRDGLAALCGCPGSGPVCRLCPAGSSFDPNRFVSPDDELTCGEIELDFRKEVILFPSIGCTPSAVDFVFQANVVDFCCNGANLESNPNLTFPPTGSTPNGAPMAMPMTTLSPAATTAPESAPTGAPQASSPTVINTSTPGSVTTTSPMATPVTTTAPATTPTSETPNSATPTSSPPVSQPAGTSDASRSRSKVSMTLTFLTTAALVSVSAFKAC
jgi:hypothetical protein